MSNVFSHFHLSMGMHSILADKDLASVIHTSVTSQLDYNNAIYLDMQLSALRKLQEQNVVAHLPRNTGYHEHRRPVLHSLNWFPIEFWIKFKISGLIYKALCGLGPGYWKDHVKLQDEDQGQQLHSSGTIELSTGRVRLVYMGGRTFSWCSLRLWNKFSQELRTFINLATFHTKYKMNFFELAFSNINT